MSLGLDDDLVLSYDDDLEENPGTEVNPAVSTAPAFSSGVQATDTEALPILPTSASLEKDDKEERATRTKAYKLAAPAGALFGRLAKVGIVGGAFTLAL